MSTRGSYTSEDLSATSLAALFDAFESQQLPKAQWTHEAHVLVALFCVLHSPDPLTRMRVGIKRLNAAHGVANTATSGYHETVTRFYVWLLKRYVAEEQRTLGPDAPIWALARGALLRASRDAPLSYYSKERIYSEAARFAFVAPDLQPCEGI